MADVRVIGDWTETMSTNEFTELTNQRFRGVGWYVTNTAYALVDQYDKDRDEVHVTIWNYTDPRQEVAKLLALPTFNVEAR